MNIVEQYGCIQVGYGVVAAIHRTKYLELGIKTLAVIDTDLNKRLMAKKAGLHVASKLKIVSKLAKGSKFLFWDVCTPTNTHLDIISQILSLDPCAAILVEKPICLFEQIATLSELMTNFPNAKIVVNENYSSCYLTNRISKILMAFSPLRIISEMSKNRCKDFLEYRYIDNENGVFGYELTHMLTTLDDLSSDFLPHKIQSAYFEDAIIDTGEQHYIYANQGMGAAKYISNSNVEVSLFTSMTNKVTYQLPYQLPPISSREEHISKHRILAVECMEGVTVAGFYEPIVGFLRNQHALIIFKNNSDHILYQESPIYEDTMKSHLKRVVAHFFMGGENPYPVSQAVKILQMCQSVVKKAYLTNRRYL